MHQTPDQHKSEITRIRAYEKEIARLKSVSSRQSHKYSRLKKISFFQLIFFLVLLIMMAFYGIIQWPSQKEASSTESQLAGIDSLAQAADSLSTVEDSTLLHFRNEAWLTFHIPDNGILFQVQIGAFTGIDLQPFALNMVSLQQYHYEGINQFTAGLFEDFENAKRFRDLLRQMGFTDAYVTATLQGKRIQVHEARNLKAAAPQNTSKTQKAEAETEAVTITIDSLFSQEVSLP